MNSIKKYFGIVWILLAIASIVLLIMNAIQNINQNGSLDINKPLPWLIIIIVFIPIAIGLILFGWFAYKDEYKN